MSNDNIDQLKQRIFELETDLRHTSNELRLIEQEYEDTTKKYLDIHFHLEEKIRARTDALDQANRLLTDEVGERKRQEVAKEKLIVELRKALEQVKLLSGFLPICSSCKKIRDDRGYWSQIESYISNHSEAEFSHGICPDCSKRLYPDLHEKIEAKKKNEP